MRYNPIKKYLAGRKTIPTVVGIRHQMGISGETRWLDDVINWLDSRIKKEDKVMLEIDEYPLSENFRNNIFPRTRVYFEELCKYIERKGSVIIPGEDKERWNKYNSYHDEKVRDNEVFIPRMGEIRPRFFLVGYSHLDYLGEQMPEFSYINLVNEGRDKGGYNLNLKMIIGK